LMLCTRPTLEYSFKQIVSLSKYDFSLFSVKQVTPLQHIHDHAVLSSLIEFQWCIMDLKALFMVSVFWAITLSSSISTSFKRELTLIRCIKLMISVSSFVFLASRTSLSFYKVSLWVFTFSSSSVCLPLAVCS